MDIRKRRIRARQRALLRSVSAADRKTKALRILKNLLAWDVYQSAQNILLFASMPDEPDTWTILKKTLKLKKRVFLPTVLSSGKLGLYRVKRLESDLVRGEFDVWEPRRLKSAKAGLSEMDLAVIPGLAFDLGGRRLGRGKGYYDRLLCVKKKPFCLGLGFEEHLLKKIPETKNDQRVQAVLTEKAFYYVHG